MHTFAVTTIEKLVQWHENASISKKEVLESFDTGSLDFFDNCMPLDFDNESLLAPIVYWLIDNHWNKNYPMVLIEGSGDCHIKIEVNGNDIEGFPPNDKTYVFMIGCTEFSEFPHTIKIEHELMYELVDDEGFGEVWKQRFYSTREECDKAIDLFETTGKVLDNSLSESEISNIAASLTTLVEGDDVDFDGIDADDTLWYELNLTEFINDVPDDIEEYVKSMSIEEQTTLKIILTEKGYL